MDCGPKKFVNFGDLFLFDWPSGLSKDLQRMFMETRQILVLPSIQICLGYEWTPLGLM